MKAFFDTEFIQIYDTPLTLVSIGILRDDGEQLYMVSCEFRKRTGGSWFKKHVWPHIADDYKHSFDEIAFAVQMILQPVRQIVVREGKNDFALLQQLAGQLPIRKIDLQKVWERVGKPELPKREGRHHALDDAHYHRNLYETLCQHVQTAPADPIAAMNQRIAEISAALSKPSVGFPELETLEKASAALNGFANNHRKYLEGVKMLLV